MDFLLLYCGRAGAISRRIQNPSRVEGRGCGLWWPLKEFGATGKNPAIVKVPKNVVIAGR